MIKSASQSSLTNDVKYRNMGAANVPSNEYLIETAIVGTTPVQSIIFSNLSQYSGIYRHLILVASGRISTSITFTSAFIRFNSDNGTNYSNHAIVGTNSSTSSEGAGATSEPYVWRISGASTSANIFSPVVLNILDAYGPINKTFNSLSGIDFPGSNPSAIVQASSGNWRNTSIINTLLVQSATGNFVTGSRFSLYGVTA